MFEDGDCNTRESIRIGILIPRSTGGGAEFVAHTWAQQLSSWGHDVLVINTIAESAETQYRRQILPASHLARVSEIRRIVRRERLDVLVGMMPYFNLLAILAGLSVLSGRPRIVVSGRNMEFPSRTLHGWRYILKDWFARVLYPVADAFIAISHPVAAEAITRYRLRAESVFVVPNPALGKVGQISEPRRELNVPEDSSSGVLNIVVPGRLVPQKRPETALAVGVRLQVMGVLARVVYFGDGELREEMRTRAQELGVDAEFRGWVERWFDHCPSGSIVLLPSVTEGFGNVLVEAAARGVPVVVSSKCLGAADALVPGVTGTLAMDDTVESFASAVLSSRAMSGSVNLHARGWLERFSPENSTRLLLEVLQGKPLRVSRRTKSRSCGSSVDSIRHQHDSR
ncbi:glycosyltransferase [Gordonia rubripertincta]|uniref:glycosyltransferase n=1 Tax=Gordonia rubripertincta TaxID=36822 RepID=UPI0015FB7F7C|nr:glycosyltransferase [Gordonia rubripertincta]